MTAFVVVCAAMVAAALVWMLLPLLRSKEAASDGNRRKERLVTAAATAVVVPLVAASMYALLSTWDWKTVAAQQEQSLKMDEALQTLEAKLAQNPNNLEGWLMLGRS